MRKVVLTAALSIFSVAGWVLGSAAGGSAAGTHDYERATGFEHLGYGSQCDASPCPVPLFSGMPFTFQTLGASYDAVVTASFTYTTDRGTRLSVSPLVHTDGIAVTPENSTRYLPPAAKARSVTLTWVIPSLSGGQGYRIAVAASPATPAPYAYRLTDITTVVEGAPV
jgi:hypothetical protein